MTPIPNSINVLLGWGSLATLNYSSLNREDFYNGKSCVYKLLNLIIALL